MNRARPSSPRTSTWLVVAALVTTASACARTRVVAPAPAPAGQVGQCADPSRNGVVSARPRLSRADRDLDGDRRPELVVTDRTLCTAQGNCYWNVYAQDASAGCQRYLGTVAASVIDRLARRGDDGFHDLRGWWQMSSDSRVLLQEYRYRHGGYRIVDTMLCRQEGDDRLQCATDR
ncbi:MAG TPA: hypothetical protein VK698_31160 [Kofleriaceae bacterium]|nr:hypothetical protein [Kofleriaceae bacterium]